MLSPAVCALHYDHASAISNPHIRSRITTLKPSYVCHNKCIKFIWIDLYHRLLVPVVTLLCVQLCIAVIIIKGLLIQRMAVILLPYLEFYSAEYRQSNRKTSVHTDCWQYKLCGNHNFTLRSHAAATTSPLIVYVILLRWW